MRRSRLAAALVVALIGGALVGAAPAADAAPERPMMARRTPAKPPHSDIKPGHSHRRMHLKFAEGTLVRVRGGRFVSFGEDDLSGVRDVLRDYPGVRVERLFDARSEVALAFEKVRLEFKSRREQADKNLYFRLVLPRGTDAEALLDDLNALAIVEIAYAEPLPAPPPSSHGTTPDFSGGQAYGDAAPNGIDADLANAVPGGTGANVRIIDIEYSWNTNHEDLSKARAAGAMIPNKTLSDPFGNDHGTAVLGELIADNNGLGVTGLAHGAGIGLTNTSTVEDGYDLADSIGIAHAALNDGDVILLEQQTSGPNACNNGVSGCVAVEWVQAYYDAIVAATSDGIIVVEAAGNGNENLDDTAVYGSPFPAGRADSGAIIVGSANYPASTCTTPAHGRRGSSTFGSRVNFHAYGECVTTTGYGTLQGGSDPNVWYSNSFNGTSSASPIVTSAAAILSSVAQQQGDGNGLSSTEVRAMLAVGATPQDTSASANTGNVGPMPDLGDALDWYLPIANAGGPYNTSEGTDVGLDGGGSSDPQGKTLTYQWDLDNNGSFETSGVSPTFTRVGQNGSFTVGLRVTDAGGATATDTATVNVTNVAPSLSLGSNAPKSEGSLVTVTGSIADPGWLEDLDGTIDWGDGVTDPLSGSLENVRPNATLSFSATHTYGDNDLYGVEVCGSDDETETCKAINLQINNVSPDVGVDPSQVTQINEGEFVDFIANFSDPGWLDTYNSKVDWGTGESEPGTLTVTSQGPPVDAGTLEASHQYGDNGEFTMTGTVADDDAGTDSDEVLLTVDNVDPSAEIDTSAATVINGQQTVISHAGDVVEFGGRSQDPGSDDLYLSWDWDDGAPAPDVTTPYLLDPPLLDFFPSPDVNPRDVTDAQVHAFTQACLFDVGFSTVDDDAGTGADNVSVIIAGNADRNRSAGYWNHQYKGNGSLDFDTVTLECYLAISGYVSQVFDEVRDASTIAAARDVLFLPAGNTAADRLDRQLLAALLNFGNGAIEYDEQFDTNGDKVADTAFGDVITTAEAVRLDPASTDADLETQKNILESINRHG